MKAVVMAGGEGTRLRPLTSNQPKPMVPIVGKPCMEHIVELLRDHGFDEVVVTLAFVMVTHHGDRWPLWIFWAGVILAAVSLAGYLAKARREVRT